ncbi:MAG: amidase [Alphaproteobacteria bacterium]
MAIAEYGELDGVALAELIAQGEISPAEVLEEAIDRAEIANPQLNAIILKDYEAARARADDLPKGPFQGVPFLIKDIVNQPLAGLKCSHGSKWLKDYVPPSDSTLISRYKAVGLNIFGKTNTPEFAITGTTEGGHLGPCRNPWNTDYSTGGSSGGAASAVAAGILPMAHSSDGLGSIRIPAASCGLVGLKPTRDRNPHGPNDGDRHISFQQDHIVSRSVRDTAAMLDATGFPEPASPYAPPPRPAGSFLAECGAPVGKLRIAFSDERPNGQGAADDVRKVMLDTAKILESMGHIVEEAAPQTDWRKLYRAQGAVSSSNLAAAVAELTEMVGRAPQEDELEPLTWAGVHTGRKLTGDKVLGGWRTLRVLCREILGFYETYDVFLCPTMITTPPPIGFIDPVNLPPAEVSKRQAKTYGYTPPQNFTGQPSISLPLGQGDNGLPVGMMFSARYGDEATLLRLSAALEEAMPWRNRQPEMARA